MQLLSGNPESPANKAARRVLIEGITQAAAAREFDLKPPTVNKAVKRISDADSLIRRVYVL